MNLCLAGTPAHLAFGLSKPSSRRATAPMATRSALLSRSWETPLSSGRLTLTLRPAPARCMSTREPAMCGRNYPSCSPVTRLSGMHSARRWTFQGPRSSLEHPWTIQRTAQTPARCMSTVLVPSTGSSRRTSLPVMVQPTTCLETQSPCRRDRSPSLERPWTTRRQGPTLARPMSSSAMDSPGMSRRISLPATALQKIKFGASVAVDLTTFRQQDRRWGARRQQRCQKCRCG